MKKVNLKERLHGKNTSTIRNEQNKKGSELATNSTEQLIIITESESNSGEPTETS